MKINFPLLLLGLGLLLVTLGSSYKDIPLGRISILLGVVSLVVFLIFACISIIW